MNQITRGAVNTIVFTLNENQTLSNPYFLFRLISEGQGTEKAFIINSADDLSDGTTRYNKFLFTESTTENLLSGTATLTEGIWEYQVYEQTSSTNLNWQSADNVVPLEVGLLKVTGTPTSTFVTPDYSSTFVWQTN